MTYSPLETAADNLIRDDEQMDLAINRAVEAGRLTPVEANSFKKAWYIISICVFANFDTITLQNAQEVFSRFYLRVFPEEAAPQTGT
ncbi:MAG TPA: hypothetical protein PKL83_00650 [bacterium]|nr:hypothetical protein [bacterium]